MSVFGIVIMWVFFAAAFAVVTAWPMGKESDRRQAYWAKYISK